MTWELIASSNSAGPVVEWRSQRYPSPRPISPPISAGEVERKSEGRAEKCTYIIR